MSEKSWVLETIETKSDQLNAQDLLTGPVDVTVVDVKRGNGEQPIVITIDGDLQPYKPCKSMRRVLIAMWGEYPQEWKGRQMRLYCDPDVMFGGVKAGGIRISHMTDIERTVLPLTVSRGRTKAYTIELLPRKKPETKPADMATRVTKAINALGECDSQQQYDKFKSLIETELLPNCSKGQESQLLAALKKAERRLSGGEEDGLD